jgi:hypothetical protein
LLTELALLERFRDASVDAFWALTSEERRAAWGPTFDFDRSEAQHDRLMAIIGFED